MNWTGLAKRIAYRSGLLSAIHRLRNRARLTVVMFHRVLVPGSPGWRDADPDYTVSDQHFTECLRFFKRHYSVISQADLVAAARAGRALPPYPLLISLDDGWADNAAVAMPLLLREQVTATLFVAVDAVSSPRRWWWHEILVSAWRRGRLTGLAQARLWQAVFGSPLPQDETSLSPARLMTLITGLCAIDDPQRWALIEPLAADLDPTAPRHMMTPEQLRAWTAAGLEVGVHGACHAPLSEMADPGADLRRGREALADIIGRNEPPPVTMSFPHGRYSALAIDAARQAGYQLMFTSRLFQTSLTAGCPRSDIIGRIEIPAPLITDPSGKLCPELLALWLFNRSTSPEARPVGEK